MPVTDLRNLLTVPQDAPQNPGFNRTRQLMGMPTNPYQSALAFERAAPGIQANQGLAYLQGIQNHQNEIAQQAQNLRIQQEAQLAAEQATQGLAGIQPDHPQYLNQRQQILQQNPNALMDPQFRNTLQVYDQGFSQFDRQRQLQQRQADAEQRQIQGLVLRGMEYGGDEGKIAKFAQARDLGGLAQVVGEARRNSLGQAKGKAPKDHRDSYYDDMVKNINHPDNLPMIGDLDESGKKLTSKDLLKIMANNAAEARRIVYPEEFPEDTPAPAGAVYVPPSPPTQVVQNDPVKEYESLPVKTEADFLRFAGRKDVPPEFRQKVIKDLGEFMARPVPQSETGASVGASLTRDERGAEVLRTAEKSAARADEDNLYNQAWNDSKLKIDEALIRMSAASGYSPEQLAETIKSGEKVLFRVDGKAISPKEWFESMIGGKLYDYASPFKKWSNTSTGGQIAGKLAAETWAKVFDSYLQEKTAPPAAVVASPQTATNVATAPPKIVVGKPVPVK